MSVDPMALKETLTYNYKSRMKWQLRMTLFHKIMVAEKNFSSNAEDNFAKGKLIFTCKNDEPWKN